MTPRGSINVFSTPHSTQHFHSMFYNTITIFTVMCQYHNKINIENAIKLTKIRYLTCILWKH